MKRFFLLVFSVLSAFSVNAACQFVPQRSPLIWNVDFGNVIVPRDVPVGGVIYQKELTAVQTGMNFITCSSLNDKQNQSMLMGGPVSGLTNVYSTNLDGVGVRVTTRNGHPFTSPGYIWNLNSTGTYILNETPYNVELIKTGTIVPGLINTGKLFTWTAPGTSGTLTIATGSITGGSVSVQSCNVLKNNIIVNFKEADVSSFQRKGHSVNPMKFSVPLSCDINTPVKITINNVSDVADKNNGVLALNKGSSARGIGVQILHNDIPAVFGDAIDFGKATSEYIDIPFESRIYQTESVVFPGKFSASAIFTMTYR